MMDSFGADEVPVQAIQATLKAGKAVLQLRDLMMLFRRRWRVHSVKLRSSRSKGKAS